MGRAKGKTGPREYDILDEEWAQRQQGKGVGKGELGELWRKQLTDWVKFPEVIFPIDWYAEVVIPDGGMELMNSEAGGSKKRERELPKRYRMSPSVYSEIEEGVRSLDDD